MKLKKSLVLFCTMLLAIFLLAACGDDNNESATNNNGGGENANQQNDGNDSNNENADDDSGEQTKISIMTKIHTPEVPDDKVIKAIKEAANVEKDIE